MASTPCGATLIRSYNSQYWKATWLSHVELFFQYSEDYVPSRLNFFLLDENGQRVRLLTLGFDRRPKKLNRLLLCFYWILESQPLGG